MLDRPAIKPAPPRTAPRGTAVQPAPRDSHAEYSFAAAPAPTSSAPAPYPEPAGEVPGIAIDTSRSSSSAARSVPRKPQEEWWQNYWVLRLVIGGGFALLMLAFAAFQQWKETPTDPNSAGYALVQITAMGSRGDWGGVYDRFARQTRQQLEKAIADRSGEKNPKSAAFRQQARDAFIQGMQNEGRDARLAFSAGVRVVSEKRSGNRATVTIRDGAKTLTLELIWEDNAWRLILQ
jgi:hypothetical protein